MRDPYAYPNGTLRNLFGLEDAAALARAESEATANRLLQIQKEPVPGAFDFDHLKRIHKAIFQDVYDFAGIPRITTLARSDQAGFEFTHPILIEKDGAALFKGLAQSNFLKDRSAHDFARDAAPFLASLNELHPFREGNGRAQRQFLKQLAVHAGHELDFSILTRPRYSDAFAEAAKGNLKPMRWMLTEAIDPLLSSPVRDGLDYAKTHGLHMPPKHIQSAEPGETYAGMLVARNGTHFMLKAGSRLVFGWSADLLADQKPGQDIQVRARDPRNHSIDQDTKRTL